MNLAQRFAAFICRLRGHVWQRRKSAEIKSCRRCGVQSAVKLRAHKERLPPSLENL